MKKIAVCVVGVLAACSLAACSPTEAKKPNTETPPIETMETKDGRAEKTPDPDAPVLEMVSIYSSNADATGLFLSLEGVENLDAESLVNQLILKGILSEGTEVKSFDIEGGEKAGPGVEVSPDQGEERIGTLDLSDVPESGTAGEAVILGAIGNTFIENFELDKLKLLVNGENYSSGHILQTDDDYLLYIDDYETFQ